MRRDLEQGIAQRGDKPSNNARLQADEQASIELIQAAIAFVVDVLGPIPIAWGARIPNSDDRETQLDALQKRLVLLSPLLRIGIPEVDWHPSSIDSAINEIHAIRMGDEPQLFARLSKRKLDHRVRVNQWRALILDAYGKGMGLKAMDRQAVIAEAYCETWGTIRKWKRLQPVKSTPGSYNPDFDADLEEAEERGKRVSWETWIEAVQEAGLAHREAKRQARSRRKKCSSG
ncbi:hypothetical protein [Sphingomonas beigongshangi]|uniref:hypothetical protein n=1 Tax=Sphingomonas beigongshangi TaxID=2782540 RepID=UPI00193C34E5|nr:hypothetical protein [Sphingomonas beigongshangi]